MTSDFYNSLTDESLSSLSDYLHSNALPFTRGIEKEGLRAGPGNLISQADHPVALGHPLTHASITTDYSEALLELITGTHASRSDLLAELSEIHCFVQKNISDEILWAGSMPCQLDGEDSIRIAEYGDSNIGRLKHVYRQGLGVRYGRVMQSIAGLHFNFSFSDEFWSALYNKDSAEGSLQDYKSEKYFGLIRNFRRESWLLMYLFGASPVLDQSFLPDSEHDLSPFDDKGSFYKPYATSLRMGDLGYHNNAQSSLAICFNTLGNFTTTLGEAIQTSYEPYEKIGLKRDGEFIQLNTNILQIENEYYSSIRPKRTAKSGERPTQALVDRGVEYIEVRCMDLNPFLPLGISEIETDFLDLFLTYCMLSDSPVIDGWECEELDKNFSLTVNEGRRPGLQLMKQRKPIALSDWGLSILETMQPLAELLDNKVQDARYSKALLAQKNKLLQSDLCPSAEVLSVMNQEGLSWLEFAGELSQKHKLFLSETEQQQKEIADKYEILAQSSLKGAMEAKASDVMDFETFMKVY